MKKDFVMPILVLGLICLVISGALAFTNEVTAPIISDAESERALKARLDIIPTATGFELLKFDGLPATVKEVYKADNGAGYVFTLETTGYSEGLQLLCGIGPDGAIIKCTTLQHSETKGLGSKVAEHDFESQFTGKSQALDGVSAITGATISSTAYINAIRDALAAFEIVRGAE